MIRRAVALSRPSLQFCLLGVSKAESVDRGAELENKACTKLQDERSSESRRWYWCQSDAAYPVVQLA